MKVRESDLKLNKTKCRIRKQSIVFLGHIISSEGIKIDPSKTEAITKIPLPRSVNELQRFLGMVRDHRQKTFGFLSRHCLLRGEGVKTNLLKNVNFQMKVVALNCNHHIILITKQRYESI